MNHRILSNIMVFLSLALAVTAVRAQDQPSTSGEATASEALKVGSPAAPLDIEHWLSDANSKFKPVTEFQDSKVYVIEFWATWCVPCIKGMPHLAHLQKKYSDQSVQVIGVTEEPLEKVEAFLKRKYKPLKTKSGGVSSEETSKPPQTYAELTSAYCLVADPDASVHNDYYRASGRSAIPCAFIVGKTGLIEWMGHPKDMDGALKSVVEDSWDRETFAKQYAAEQKRDLMLARVSKIFRSGPSDEAEKLIDQARKEFAADAKAMKKLDGMKAAIITDPLYECVDAGENVKALAMIKELLPTVSQIVQRQLLALQAKLQIEESQFDEAVKTLTLVEKEDSFPPVELTKVAREIYQQSKGNEKFPRDLFVAGVTLSQKAVDKDRKNSYYLSTLARMQYGAGDLDAAIETQTKAVANSDGRNKGYQVILNQLKAEKDSIDDTE